MGWTYLGVLTHALALIFVTGWSVRRVGLAQYGVWALVVSLTDLLALLDYGLGQSITHGAARAVARELDDDERAAGRDLVAVGHSAYALLGAVALGVAALAAAVVQVTGLRGVSGVGATVAILGVATGLTVGTAALPALAVGCQRFSLRAGASVTGTAARVIVVVLTLSGLGIAGLALAKLVSVMVERVVLAVGLRRAEPWLRLRPERPRPQAVRRTMSFAVPLLVLNVSGQLFALSDLVTVSIFVGSAAVGLYQVGALLPLHFKSLLFTGYKVVYPAMAGSSDEQAQERATALLTTVVSFVAGLGFATCIALRGDLVELLSGHRDPLAETVLVLFCLAGFSDVGVHGAAWLLVARGKQKLMARAVVLELPLNLVLSVLLVVVLGAVGAAWATLVTVIVMDVIVFPRLSRGQFSRSATALLLRNGVAPGLCGAVLAVAVALATGGVAGPLARVVLTAAGAGALGLVFGLTLLPAGDRRALRSTLERAPAVTDSASRRGNATA